MRIACLHTADSNIAVFEAAARELDLREGTLHHSVRADLLAAAEAAGALTPAIAADTRALLTALSRDCDAVVLTCSTLGPVVDTFDGAALILRVDAALAEEAATAGGRIVALCAVATTLEPTAQLFERAASVTGASVDVRLVDGAWALFKAGDLAGYLASIARAADRAYDDGATVVALAQASMAGAAELVEKGPRPLRSPTSGLSAAAALAARIRSASPHTPRP